MFDVQPTHHPPEQTWPAAHWLFAVQEQPFACVQEQYRPEHASQS